MGTDSRRRRFKTLELLLFAGGVACLGWFVVVESRAWRYQRLNHTVAAQAPRPAPESAPALERAAPPTALPIGEPIGRIEVPRLHLSAVVANGDDDGTLSVAIGHLPDTPLPWDPGNSALAGHRDTFFRELRNIRVNDEMRVATAYGDFTYEVKRTLIVTPDDLSVLAPTSEPTLTLITCYPFSYVGHAPKRFIVQAVRTRPAAPAVVQAFAPASHF